MSSVGGKWLTPPSWRFSPSDKLNILSILDSADTDLSGELVLEQFLNNLLVYIMLCAFIFTDDI